MAKPILLVDPNPDVLAKIGKFLEDFGFVVERAVSQKEALDKIKFYAPTIVVANLQLPDGGALQVVEQAREKLKCRAPFIVMAATRQIEENRRSGSVGRVQAWVTWPVDQMELYLKVTEWSDREIDPEPASPKAHSPAPFADAASSPRKQPVRRPRLAIGMPMDDRRRDETIGNLARAPVPRLLRELGLREETGLLTINHSPYKMQVHFRDGLIVHVVSNYIPELSLGIVLAKKGDISASELASARKRWEREGGLFGQILLSMELIAGDKLDQTLVEQWIKKILSLFDWHWRIGTFVFLRGVDKIELQDSFRLRVDSAIVAGVKACYSRERLLADFAFETRRDTAFTLHRTSAKNMAAGADADDFQRTLDALRVGRTLGQALAVSGMPELTFLRNAYALYILDAFNFPDD